MGRIKLMQPLRFGNVACLHGMQDKDRAKSLATPVNRVLFYASRDQVFIVNGQEDIQTVDHLLQNRDAFAKKQEEDLASVLNNSLFHFLLLKSNGVVDGSGEYADDTLELL